MLEDDTKTRLKSAKKNPQFGWRTDEMEAELGWNCLDCSKRLDLRHEAQFFLTIS